ncbi:right-handed parallel beta-helix repeat-containing protein [Parapedobacter sp. ISTM3]|uniref:right-handed parallel beta-helix repeat-containing protein n=1 Tax=Parapedobacter sp. ISTM3 TaxID=2800130 RepID=UPI0019076868|nr:right-handed parallel beta-helix repeat-containing protein [Parapedobacter sp. ISTM3]MBK1439500.1 right-handed parallel beta-helix repeat-containing protein [Parapedobacter sp. ISTM3]
MHHKSLSLKTAFAAIIVCTGIFLAGCGQEKPAGEEQPGLGRRLDVRSFGARGNGKADDSKAIQAVIDEAAPGDTVYLPKGDYLVRTLRLAPNVHFVAEGVLRQPKALSDSFSVEKQHSDAPLFRAHRVSNIYLSFRAETVNEAIYASQCSNITIANSHIAGDSTNRRSFPGILWYSCSACRVVGSTVSHYGIARKSAKSYNPGTAIRVLSSRGVTVSGNELHHNGENGIFVHDSGDIEIDGNYIHHNGMSGIQVAFNSAELVTNYRITNNRLEYNAADAIDINNRAHGVVMPVRALIAGNYSWKNGFVSGESTPDGSGIGTLIGISDVTLSGNRAFGNNRPALYVEGCGTITANRNLTDGAFELVGRWDSIRMEGNTFPTLRLLANADGRVLHLKTNRVTRALLPNDIRIDSLLLEENEIESGPVNINMEGNLRFEGNTLISGHDAGALLLVKVGSAFLKGNRITNKKNAAIAIGKTAHQVVIDSNFVSSGGAALHDAGSPGLQLTRNALDEQVTQP